MYLPYMRVVYIQYKKNIKNEKSSRNGTGQKSNETRNVTCCFHNNYMLNVFLPYNTISRGCGLIEGHAYSVFVCVCVCVSIWALRLGWV